MKKFLMALLILVALGSLSLKTITNFTISDGDRVGTVTKFSHKSKSGLMKTWEGDLLLGSQGSVAGSTWSFSVNDESLVEPIKKVMREQKPVTLHYYQYWYVLPWQGETQYFITEVVPALNHNK